MKNYFEKMMARLREPSTIAGLGIIALMLGAKPGEVDAVTQALVLIAGVGAAAMPEARK